MTERGLFPIQLSTTHAHTHTAAPQAAADLTWEVRLIEPGTTYLGSDEQIPPGWYVYGWDTDSEAEDVEGYPDKCRVEIRVALALGVDGSDESARVARWLGDVIQARGGAA